MTGVDLVCRERLTALRAAVGGFCAASSFHRITPRVALIHTYSYRDLDRELPFAWGIDAGRRICAILKAWR